MMHSYLFSPGASQQFSSIRIPAKAAVQLLTTLLVFSLWLFPNLAAAAMPHIYDAPNAGPPGSQTMTVGNGWDPNATIDIYLDSTSVGVVGTDSNGTFGMALKAPTIRQNGLTIQISKDAVPGRHWITAVERITQLQAQVAFTVSADWAQFHFDAQHTGYNPYENVLSPDAVRNLTTRWTYSIGQQSDSPSVANGVVYAGSNFPADPNLYALDAGTGALLWKFPIQVSGVGGPAVVNGVVYVGGCSFQSLFCGLYALNASSGVFLWKCPLLPGNSPTVANGVVYIDSGYDVYAVDAGTGVPLWKYATGKSIGGAPAVANGVVYAGSEDGNLYALDAGTGAFLWKFALTPDLVDHAPTVANGIVYITSGGIYAINASTGALIWEYGAAYMWGTPAVANGLVYVGSVNHKVYALGAATGSVLWVYTTDIDVYSAPAVANGVVYVNTAYGNIYALNASTGTYLWMSPPVAATWPAVANGMLYIAGSGNIYAFGLPKQQMSEKFSPPERPDPAQLTPNWNHPLKK